MVPAPEFDTTGDVARPEAWQASPAASTQDRARRAALFQPGEMGKSGLAPGSMHGQLARRPHRTRGN